MTTPEFKKIDATEVIPMTMYIDRVRRNKEFIEYYELEFAPSWRSDYIKYCAILAKEDDAN